jgi:hypothetical protein
MLCSEPHSEALILHLKEIPFNVATERAALPIGAIGPARRYGVRSNIKFFGGFTQRLCGFETSERFAAESILI